MLRSGARALGDAYQGGIWSMAVDAVGSQVSHPPLELQCLAHSLAHKECPANTGIQASAQ